MIWFVDEKQITGVVEKLPYEFLCAKFELDFVIAHHTRFDFTLSKIE